MKLVFILREPVDRAYSNYLWTRMNGLETEDFQTALRLEDQRERELPERLKFARPFSYFSRGLYADLLTPYVECFPRDQIAILRFEDILATPTAVAERLHRFLGVPARPDDAHDLGVINPSERSTTGMAATIRDELRELYAEPNQRLAKMLPEFEMWE